jgi:type II secretory pathway component GspD/PulD (secretin)
MTFLNPIKGVLLIVMCCVLIVQPAVSANKRNLISISVRQTEVAELFEMLSRQNNVNILLAKGVTGEVSVNLYNISAKEAIYAIAAAAGLAVERINKGYLISPRSEVGKTIVGGLKEVRTYKVQYSDSSKVAEILEKHLSQYGKLDMLEDRKILVVEDLPEFLGRIEYLLEQLDQPPAQILIEARILQIALDDNLEYGVDWTKTFTAGGGKGNAGVENLGKQVTDLAIGAAAGPPGLFFNYFNDTIEAQLNLLSQKGKVRSLATPSLLALEHQEAEVVIGDRKGYKLTTVNVGVSTESIQFLESGVILRVKPYIDRNGRVMMEVHPEISSGTVNDDTGVPDQTTTEVTTRLLVDNGATVFIGGLINNVVDSDHQGVPILEDIPFLGYLFSTDSESSLRTETVVMIKPQIIRPDNMELITHNAERTEQFDRFNIKNADQINEFFNKKEIYKKQPGLQ